MTDQTPPPAPGSPRRGYPGRPALDHAESRLRAALTQLARDPDTHDQAGTLAAAAATALTEITEAAYKVVEESPRYRARMKRQQRRTAGLFERRGRPVPPSLLDTPERGRDSS